MIQLILCIALVDPAGALQAIVDRAAADGKFSGVVLLAKDGKPVMLRAWGDGNRTDTKFNLASINKIFTQTAIAQLAAAGKLSLNDTVRKHLPDYPSPIADKITIQQLVDHKSGLGDFFGPEYLAAPPSSIRKLSDYLPLFVDKPLQFEPGTEQRYSNAGFIVLGLIIERVTGQSYYEYVREHIFKPAGMKDTDSFAIDAKVPNRATPVTKRGSTQLPGRGSSAGGGYSTAEDLLRFSQALRADEFVSKKWTDWIFRGNEQRSLGVAGGSPGINTILLMGSPYTLVVLSNFDPPAAEEIARAARPILGMPAAQQRRVARQAEPDEVIIQGPVDLPITFPGHLPVIEAKINGKGPFRFGVDTGFGGMVEVSDKLQSQLSMPVVGEEISGDPSGRNAKTVRALRAESFDIGAAHFEGIDVLESANRHLGDVDGIIGLNLFHGLLVTFDYPNSRLQLRVGTLPAEGALSYTTEHGVPTVEIDVNGQKMKTDIDSRSPGEVTLPLSAAKSLALSQEPRVVGHGRTAGGEFDLYGAPLIGEVRVGSIVLTNPRIDFVDLFPIGNLGSRFLMNLVITFDPVTRRVRLVRPT
jgi:CubicO group peptidase (beta-lactamase class C family)